MNNRYLVLFIFFIMFQTQVFSEDSKNSDKQQHLYSFQNHTFREILRQAQDLSNSGYAFQDKDIVELVELEDKFQQASDVQGAEQTHFLILAIRANQRAHQSYSPSLLILPDEPQYTPRRQFIQNTAFIAAGISLTGCLFFLSNYEIDQGKLKYDNLSENNRGVYKNLSRWSLGSAAFCGVTFVFSSMTLLLLELPNSR